jgi:hypothetical protein
MAEDDSIFHVATPTMVGVTITLHPMGSLSIHLNLTSLNQVEVFDLDLSVDLDKDENNIHALHNNQGFIPPPL